MYRIAALNKPDVEAEEIVQDSFEIQVSECLIKYNDAIQKMVEHKGAIERGIDLSFELEEPTDLSAMRSLSSEELFREILAADVMKDDLDLSSLKDAEVRHRVKALALKNLAYILSKRRGCRADAIKYYSQAADFADRSPSPGYDPRKPDLELLHRLLDLALAPLAYAGNDDAMDIDEVSMPHNQHEDRVYLGLARSCCERILAVNAQNLEVAKRYCDVLLLLHDETNCSIWVRKILSTFPTWQHGHDILAYLGQRFESPKRKFDGEDSAQQKKRLRAIVEMANLANNAGASSNICKVIFNDSSSFTWSELGRKLIDILDSEGQARAHITNLLSFELCEEVEKPPLPATPKTKRLEIIELSSSLSNDSPTLPKADPMEIEKPSARYEWTMKDIEEHLEKSDAKVERSQGENAEGDVAEGEADEEEEVVEIRKTRNRSAIEKNEKRAPKHIERVTTLRSRRKETGEEWSLGAVVELVQSFFGPNQIVLDDSDEEDKKTICETEASIPTEADGAQTFATLTRKKTYEFVKAFEGKSVLNCLLAYIDQSFEILHQLKLEDLDLFRLLQVVDLRSEICIVDQDQRTLGHDEAARAVRRDIELADICFDLSARNFSLEKADWAVLKEKALDYLQKGLGLYSRYFGLFVKDECLEIEVRFNFLRLLLFSDDIPFAFEYLDGLQNTFETLLPNASFLRANCSLDNEISLKTIEAKFTALKEKLSASAAGSASSVEIAAKIDPAVVIAQFEATWLKILKDKKELGQKSWVDLFQYHSCLVEAGLYDRALAVFSYIARHAKLQDDNKDALADVFLQARLTFATLRQKRIDVAEKLSAKEEMKLRRLLSTMCSLLQEELLVSHKQTELHTQEATSSARVISAALVLVEELASSLTPQLRAGEFSRPISLDLLSFVLRLRMLVEGVKELRDKKSAYRLCGSSLLRRVCILLNIVFDFYDEARAAEPPKVKLFPSAREREELAQLGDGGDDIDLDLETLRAKRVKRRSNDPENKMNISEIESELFFATLPAEKAIDRYYIDLFELSVDVPGQQQPLSPSGHIASRKDDERWDSFPEATQIYLEHYFYLEKLTEEYCRSGKQEVLVSFYKALQRYQQHFFPKLRDEISKNQMELERYLSGEIDTFAAPGTEEDSSSEEEGDDFDPLKPDSSAELAKLRAKQLREIRRSLWNLLAKVAKGIAHIPKVQDGSKDKTDIVIPKAQVDEHRMYDFYLNMSRTESWVEFAAMSLKKAESELSEKPRRRAERRALPAEERAQMAAVCRKIHRTFAAASLHVSKDKEKYLKDKGYWLMQEASFADEVYEAADAMDIDEPPLPAPVVKKTSKELYREALTAFQESFELDPENWLPSFLASKVCIILKEPSVVILHWLNRSACAAMGLPVPGRSAAIEVGSPRGSKRKKPRQIGTIAFPIYRMHSYRLSLLLKEGSLKELPFDYLSDPLRTGGLADISAETLRLLELYAFVKPSTVNEDPVPIAEPSKSSLTERVDSVFRNIVEAFQHCLRVRAIAHYAEYKMACIYRFGPPAIRNTAEAGKLLYHILHSSTQVLPKLWYEAVGFPVEGKQISDKRKYVSQYLSFLDEQGNYEEAKTFLTGLVYDFRLNRRVADDIFVAPEQHCYNLVWRKYFVPRFDAEKRSIESSETTAQDWLRRLYELHFIQSGYASKPHNSEIETRLVLCFNCVLLNQYLFPRLAQIEAMTDGVLALARIEEIIRETQTVTVAEKANALITKLLTDPKPEVAQSVANEFAQLFKDTPVILLLFGAAFALNADAGLHAPFLNLGNALVAPKKASIQLRVNLVSALDFCNTKWPNIKTGTHKLKLH